MTAPLRVAVEGVGEVVVPWVADEFESAWRFDDQTGDFSSVVIDASKLPQGAGAVLHLWFATEEPDVDDHCTFCSHRSSPEEAVRKVITLAMSLLSDEMKAKLRGEL